MDLSTTLKFLHVLAATLWVGGGFSIILASIVMVGRSSAEAQFNFIRATVLLHPRLFVPVSLITLTSGLALLFVAGWGWEPFAILGVAGVLVTAGVGLLVLGPAGDRALKIEAEKGAQVALPHLRQVQRLALMDYTIQFSIVFLMVVKPAWNDIAVLGGLALVIVLAIAAASQSLTRTT
ncbi:MAG: DUF2269 domain-containing protein [Tabrizicola sp.]|nr:DUF2269 domain-containing protein [Tabrizicola sp.]